MHKQFKSVGLMTLLMALPSGAMMAANAPSEVATVQQQKSSVAKGSVKDANGEPLIGASVMVKGSANGATVDAAGNFTIKGVKVGQTLRISYIGYEGQEVKWEGQALNIVLKESNNSFSEAVVIGYGVAKKNDMTGSVSAIKPDEKNKGLVVNAQDMIQGKIAGVNVTTSSGTPGAGATIRIRGGSSLNASNDPLIVIDGLAMDNQGVKGLSNPLSMVNPADIESFTVLKDASATAIYGSRGSNGVIIITTKKGRKGAQLKVSYNGSMSVNQKRRVQEVMSGNQFVEFVKTYYGEGSDAYKALGVMEDGKQKFYNTDWQNEIYRTALSFDNNVTVTGSVKNVPFRASVGATNQEGILRTSDFNRYTASLNVNPSLLDDHLKVNLSAKYMFAKTVYADGGAMGAALGMDPTKPVRTADPRFKNFGGYFQWLQEGSVLKDSKWPETKIDLATANPLSMIDLKNDVAKSNAFVGNLELDYQVHGLKDLRLHMNLGADVSGGRQDTEISPASGTNTYYGYSGWEKINKYNLSYNAYAQYTKDFSKTQHFDVMAGYEWQHFYREGFSKGSGFYPQTNDVENLRGKVYQPKKDEWKTENYLVSFFGRANYSLADRYLFTATFRYDGSSRFENHWAMFPSFAFGWKINNEQFLKNVEWLSDLKLRLGYGQTGQQDGIGDYNYFASYNTNIAADSYYPIVGTGHLDLPNAYNRKLSWETTTTYNGGFDFGFWNQRLSGSIDYYYRKTTDLINTVDVPAGSNFKNRVSSNIGSLTNSGVELTLNWKAIAQKDWFWEIGVNATYNKNEITELVGGNVDNYSVPTGGISAGTGGFIQAHAVGHPASSFYVYQQVYDKNGVPLEGVYVDRNGDGKINNSDKYFYKSPMAPWTGGFTSKLQYKQWDFGFSLRASLDNYVYNDLEAGSANVSTVFSKGFLSNRPVYSLQPRWTTEDNAFSDRFVQNGSFLRMENITLGYSFENLFKGARYQGVNGRLYVSASNVFTLTKYKGIDPDVFGGIDKNVYPRPFTILAGVSLNF